MRDTHGSNERLFFFPSHSFHTTCTVVDTTHHIYVREITMNKKIPAASFGAVILLFTSLLLSLAACAPSSQKTSTTPTGHASSASRPGSLAQITSTTKHN